LQASRDGERFIDDLRRCISQSTGFDAVMRVSASTGLRPTGFFGAFFMANTTDIELGNVDCDKAIVVEVKHDDKLREDDMAFWLCVCVEGAECVCASVCVHMCVCGRERDLVCSLFMYRQHFSTPT
jgi:hypothetical protein